MCIRDRQRRVAQCQEGVGRRKLIIDSLAVESGQSILDLGCGGGYQVRSLALAVGSGGRVVGNDPSLKQIEAAREYCSDCPGADRRALRRGTGDLEGRYDCSLPLVCSGFIFVFARGHPNCTTTVV